MRITVNGEPRETSDGSGIIDLLNDLGIHPNTVLIELNEQALFKQDWPEIKLGEGDRLEIIRVVAGG